MKYIEHEFNGVTRRLSFTAGALFRVYDKFGYSSSVVEALKLTELTTEGWNNNCWLYALMAEQGNLQRKALYMDPQPLISYEQLRTQASPADVGGIRQTVLDCLQLGFSRDRPSEPDEEVDELLMELEEMQKKKTAAAASSLLGWLQERITSIIPPGK